MAPEQSDSSFPERQGEGRRSGRPGPGREGGREPGGFRIRLSDNEMRAARAVQEAFGLRSTVAALGFALRATAQMLEQGKLDELVEQQRSQAPARGEGRRGDAPRGQREGRSERGPRIDPFARPARPAAPQPVAEPEPLVAEANESGDEPAVESAPEAAEAQAESTEA